MLSLLLLLLLLPGSNRGAAPFERATAPEHGNPRSGRDQTPATRRLISQKAFAWCSVQCQPNAVQLVVSRRQRSVSYEPIFDSQRATPPPLVAGKETWWRRGAPGRSAGRRKRRPDCTPRGRYEQKTEKTNRFGKENQTWHGGAPGFLVRAPRGPRAMRLGQITRRSRTRRRPTRRRARESTDRVVREVVYVTRASVEPRPPAGQSRRCTLRLALR